MNAAEKRRLILAMMQQSISPDTIARCTDGITRDDVDAVLEEIERQAIVDVATHHVMVATTNGVLQ